MSIIEVIDVRCTNGQKHVRRPYQFRAERNRNDQFSAKRTETETRRHRPETASITATLRIRHKTLNSAEMTKRTSLNAHIKRHGPQYVSVSRVT